MTLAGADWQPVTIGMSGAQVFRLDTPGDATRYLKTAAGPHSVELRAEHDRLLWLNGRLPVPAVLAWAQAGEGMQRRVWLLLAESPGVMSCEPDVARDPQRVCEQLAAALRRIHCVSIGDCPFGARLARRLQEARRFIDSGLTDEAAIRTERGHSALELLTRLETTCPVEPTADIVFTHGDYCLPNVLLDSTSFTATAFLDWGRAGIADRYQDLAIGVRSVRHNLGAEWGVRFLEAYGLDQFDAERLAWYEALDELF